MQNNIGMEAINKDGQITMFQQMSPKTKHKNNTMNIGRNIHLEQTHDLMNRNADSILQRALKMVTNHIKVTDMSKFKLSFTGYTMMAIKNDDVLKYVDADKLINTTNLRDLEVRYNQYAIDKSKYDYNLVLTNDLQINTYKDMVKIMEIFNNIKDIDYKWQNYNVPFLHLNDNKFTIDVDAILMLK